MDQETARALEEANERRFYFTAMKVVWSSLVLLGGSGVLVVITALLGWGTHFMLCLLGLLAGLALSVAMLTSPHARALTSLVLGGVTLPLLAAVLGAVAVDQSGRFFSYSAVLYPFLAYAVVTLTCGVSVGRIWRAGSRPSATESETVLDVAPSSGRGASP